MVNERAKQFGAFSPLRGYHELIKAKERVVVDKKELSDESAKELSDKLTQIEKGMMVGVVHYCGDAYVSTKGVVTQIDFTFRNLTIVKMKIDFDDIYDVEVCGGKS